ncbi:hypothetical protein [uncultured Aquimarina sp.]|uniref:hypothetical protein n=1 Tax=uncultured Aquimarina sp. TaxID=575652 RepID=UPI00262BC7ED|nr:hypothetical protein [uncultured Aquimarina sp.]
MKNSQFKILGIAIIMIFFSASTSVFAQKGNGWGQNSNYGRNFNANEINTVTGTVTAVERILPNKNMSYGLHLKVKTNTETVSVHLGPTWFLDNQEIQFSKGDQVNVTGSRIIFEDAPAIIAIEVVKDEHILYLRDKNGYPVWSGWRKGMTKRGVN